MDTNLEFFSHVMSRDFDILHALLTLERTGKEKRNSLLTERDYACYAPDHHQYWTLLAKECLEQTGYENYEALLGAVCAKFLISAENLEEAEHSLVWEILAKVCSSFTEEDYIRFALELRVQPAAYTFEGIKRAIKAKYAEKEILPMYKISLCVNALILGYFSGNRFEELLSAFESELRSVAVFGRFKLFEQEKLPDFTDGELFSLALVLAVIALRKKDQVFYGRSGDSKAELVRKLKRFTVLLKTVPFFLRNENKPEIMPLAYAFNRVYLGRYNMPLPREMACEMLFGTLALSGKEQKMIAEAEKTTRSLEEITKQLLALGITKDQMQDLIGILALSNNKLIKIENIFIEWAVKLGLR